jgi:2-polyprenyl-3-methyl-5-hydroxy-6-metoxy-1,4-benzoquinol methylase
MVKRLVKNKAWISSYIGTVYGRHENNDAIYQFIRKYVPIAQGDEECFELGSYPGTYVSEFGELGYILNGIDIHPENSKSMPQWLGKNYRVGDFVSNDIFKIKIIKQYDVVVSFGFIEHFYDYFQLINMHDKLLKPGGILLITAPNYRGIARRFIHWYFDKKDYYNHNISSMQPKKWEQFLKNKNYGIIFCGYFGGYRFWINSQRKFFPNRILFKIFIRFSLIIDKILFFDSSFFSKHCAIVAVKNETE